MAFDLRHCFRKYFEKDGIQNIGFVPKIHYEVDSFNKIAIHPNILRIISSNWCNVPVEQWLNFLRHSRNDKKGDCYYVLHCNV